MESTFQDWLYNRWVDSGISMRQFAKQTRMSQASMSLWLAGSSVPLPHNVVKLARYFGVNERELLALAGHGPDAVADGDARLAAGDAELDAVDIEAEVKRLLAASGKMPAHLRVQALRTVASALRLGLQLAELVAEEVPQRPVESRP